MGTEPPDPDDLDPDLDLARVDGVDAGPYRSSPYRGYAYCMARRYSVESSNLFARMRS
jgi:hypothetical protein